jgi:glycerophosphoryl diester phosphodiesterase
MITCRRVLCVAVFAPVIALAGLRTSRADTHEALAPPKHGGVYVVAHRGAHTGIPENTLAAYRKAIELGVDFVEIDLRVTKDHRMVSIHNSEIDNYVVDGQTGKVADLTLEQLKRLDIGSRVGPEWKNERIPTFEEILDLCQGKVGIYVDLKGAPVDAAVALVRQRGMTKRVLWYADGSRLERIQATCADCIVTPDPGPEANLEALIDRFHPRVIAAVWKFYSESFAKKCHQAGAIVIVDERDKTSWPEALRWGTDGIQTDTPAELIEFLERSS